MTIFTTETSFIFRANTIIDEAIANSVSDIHIEPYNNQYRIRIRKHGALSTLDSLNIDDAIKLISRIKILSKLDTTETRLPQDGSFRHNNIDIRVSTNPTINGEKIALRLLNSDKTLLNLDSIGLSKNQLHCLKHKLNNPYGLILVTGPTNSGKTITLYSAINYLSKKNLNICSIEDPVEIKIDGINQTSINNKINYNFALGLKAILRQDPNVIMIGEIRDSETAHIAMQAANTGHLVLATLHTNSAKDAFNRLNYLGIKEYFINDATCLVVNQRLIKTLCSHCKLIDFTFKLSNKNILIYKPGKCSLCINGFNGKTAVFEFHSVNSNKSYNPLLKSMFEKVFSGITSISELRTLIKY